MKTWCIVATTLLSLVLGAAGIATATLMRGGISARVEPSALEGAIARRLRAMAIPGDANRAKNPLPRSADVLATGRAHFADHCASCHANDGSGDTKLGRSLYPRAPDMRKPETQQLSDGALFYIIENGVRLTGMPAWGGEGPGHESWALVHFIRHLPQLSAEERAAMERLNPRSAEEWRELQEDDDFLGDGATDDSTAREGHHDH